MVWWVFFAGLFCGEEIDECADDPCQHGICVDLLGDYKCLCLGAGWTGIKFCIFTFIFEPVNGLVVKCPVCVQTPLGLLKYTAKVPKKGSLLE